MGDLLNPAIAVETVKPAAGAILTLVPDGYFHRQIREQDRLSAAPAQARAQAEVSPIQRQLKTGRRLAVFFVNNRVRFQPKNPVQGNPVFRIEKMIEADRAA